MPGNDTLPATAAAALRRLSAVAVLQDFPSLTVLGVPGMPALPGWLWRNTGRMCPGPLLQGLGEPPCCDSTLPGPPGEPQPKPARCSPAPQVSNSAAPSAVGRQAF